MTQAEIADFESEPNYEAALRIRAWDDAAKVPDQRTPSIGHSSRIYGLHRWGLDAPLAGLPIGLPDGPVERSVKKRTRLRGFKVKPRSAFSISAFQPSACYIRMNELD